MHGWRCSVLALTIGVVALLPAGCGTLLDSPAAASEPSGARAGSAAAALATLPVKGRAPKTGYARDRFGPSWSDIDHDGCDQRNQVLARDMVAERFKPGTHDCVVLSGTLDDPYTGHRIMFVRGARTSDDVQIDHVVALSDAWQKGAGGLDAATRKRIGNDPLNLIAVDGPTNAAKRDGDAATWLPPNKAYRCAYVARQIAVKLRYHLWVGTGERDAIRRVLGSCPGETLPADPNAPANGYR